MTDIFGNYIIQKLLEYGTPKEKELLVEVMRNKVLTLSLHAYGCRVVQKTLECVSRVQQSIIIDELQKDTIRCMKSQHGNHVIQKAIEMVPLSSIQTILRSFCSNIIDLATHPYGCRVVQRVIVNVYDVESAAEANDQGTNDGTDDAHDAVPITWENVKSHIVKELLENIIFLVQDQYGNYVVQYMLERGTPTEKTLIVKKVCSQILHLSRHKFASNVVEKCIKYGSYNDRKLLIDEIVKIRPDGSCHLIMMIKDQFANYVVQRILDVSDANQSQELTKRIVPHLQVLKKFYHGKYLTSKLEKMITA